MFLAVYSNARVVTSVASSFTTISSHGFGLENYTNTNSGQIERAFVVPNIVNNGYLPVTMSINAAFLNSLGHTVGTPLRDSITIAPGEGKPLVIPAGLTSSSDIRGITGIHISLEISSIAGLVGGGLSVTVY